MVSHSSQDLTYNLNYGDYQIWNYTTICVLWKEVPLYIIEYKGATFDAFSILIIIIVL